MFSGGYHLPVLDVIHMYLRGKSPERRSCFLTVDIISPISSLLSVTATIMAFLWSSTNPLLFSSIYLSPPNNVYAVRINSRGPRRIDRLVDLPLPTTLAPRLEHLGSKPLASIEALDNRSRLRLIPLTQLFRTTPRCLRSPPWLVHPRT